MPTKAKLFIGMTIAAGTLFLVGCLGRSNNFADLPIYISCFALALLSSALKVRVPGITGNISTNFLFVLIAITIFSFDRNRCAGFCRVPGPVSVENQAEAENRTSPFQRRRAGTQQRGQLSAIPPVSR